ncbi:MAG TPA: hypothetical protein DCO73_03370, partial [Alphaproteobacteria bacterium]|nr:hypothetical protein [Alphaproteobacteria bacterium]
MSVSLPLKAAFGLRQLQIDNRVVIDLLKQPPQPESVSASAAVPAEAPQAVVEPEVAAPDQPDNVNAANAGDAAVASTQPSAEAQDTVAADNAKNEVQQADKTREAVAELLADVTAADIVTAAKQKIELRIRQIPGGARISV